MNLFPSSQDPTASQVNESGKLVKLLELVTKFNDKNEATIIAASSVSSLEAIDLLFKAVGYDVFRIDGRTTSVREEQINR